jgi:hypothetical protein
MMLSVPTFMFYIASGMMVVVCAALAVLIFYLIGAARTVLRIMHALEESGRKAHHAWRQMRRAFEFALIMFDGKD